MYLPTPPTHPLHRHTRTHTTFLSASCLQVIQSCLPAAGAHLGKENSVAHMKIALLKCKNIPPTVSPPSASLVILLKSTVLCASLAFVLSKLPEGGGWLMGPPLLADPQAWHAGHLKAALCSCMKVGNVWGGGNSRAWGPEPGFPVLARTPAACFASPSLSVYIRRVGIKRLPGCKWASNVRLPSPSQAPLPSTHPTQCTLSGSASPVCIAPDRQAHRPLHTSCLCPCCSLPLARSFLPCTASRTHTSTTPN